MKMKVKETKRENLPAKDNIKIRNKKEKTSSTDLKTL